MKTTLDIVDILWLALNGSDLKAAITGGLFKHIRPVNSTKEDVVINSLPNVNLDLAQAIANVNIHVPNPTQNLNGVQDNSQPDSVRLKELASLAVTALNDQYGEDYNYDIQQQVLIRDEVSGDWYYNIRLNFFSINVT